MNFRLFFSLCSGLVAGWLITSIHGSSISLTVEGGHSLIGLFCPGIVTLKCSGTDLTSIRWRYNDNLGIITYFPDRRTSIQPIETAFFNVQLEQVEQNPVDPNLGNFSSSLMTSYSQLQSNNITEISCSTPGISRSVPVNVNIIPAGAPNRPMITMVITTYKSGELKSIELKWNTSDNYCPSHGLLLSYEVNITDQNSVRINQSSCVEMECSINFSNLTGSQVNDYIIFIKAENKLGSSGLIKYPITIAQQLIFSFEVSVKDNQIVGQCIAPEGFIGAKECSIQYSILFVNQAISGETSGSLGSELLLGEALISTATYNLSFSVIVNNTLQIIENTIQVLSSNSAENILDREVAIIVVVTLIIFATVVTVPIIIVICVIRKKGKKGLPPERPILSILPIYEEDAKGKQKRPKYHVEVKFQEKTSTVTLRYEDFQNLHKNLTGNRKIKIQLPTPTVTKDFVKRNEQTQKFYDKDIEKQKTEILNLSFQIIKIPGITQYKIFQETFKECCELLHEVAGDETSVLIVDPENTEELYFYPSPAESSV